MEYRDELMIAKKAEQMLTSALRNRTKSFKEHYHQDAKDSLKEAYAKARTKKYGKKKDGNQQIFMRSLAIRMPEHGFVQHYGVDTVRSGGTRERHKPKDTAYRFKAHYFKMKGTPFIDNAIEESGVVDFVANSVGKIKSREIWRRADISIKTIFKINDNEYY
ncbi:hypothetical protein [Riemerella columbipharyngis]|uniref:Uncharacterized protein n=1 Tax=Riemerella columbipharyngis TaxID=1071918 RepID=A0A1G7EZZ9_9FLAO|nr:hypothetical protein [Riemerella columbipharyngis]SDE69241.1 hypothetical protein SAMN05421544_11841 [Riemerella columbipharyngis]